MKHEMTRRVGARGSIGILLRNVILELSASHCLGFFNFPDRVMVDCLFHWQLAPPAGPRTMHCQSLDTWS